MSKYLQNSWEPDSVLPLLELSVPERESATLEPSEVVKCKERQQRLTPIYSLQEHLLQQTPGVTRICQPEVL